ncbi:hypothetical protein LWI29_027744 [Acer saccharum]|uniref:Uncharacterized protein n=1 Tax=Acer saccharum TaxID=4024 RepID=A0AA39RXU3_ACESA|nr:hypothetical protein LWI29_027744 [Acer saccharum]
MEKGKETISVSTPSVDLSSGSGSIDRSKQEIISCFAVACTDVNTDAMVSMSEDMLVIKGASMLVEPVLRKTLRWDHRILPLFKKEQGQVPLMRSSRLNLLLRQVCLEITPLRLQMRARYIGGGHRRSVAEQLDIEEDTFEEETPEEERGGPAEELEEVVVREENPPKTVKIGSTLAPEHKVMLQKSAPGL